MNNNITELVKSLINSINDGLVLETITKELKAKELYISSMATMGGTLKEKITQGVESASGNINTQSTNEVIDGSITKISEIYSNKKGQVSKTFWVCLLGVSFTLILLIIGLIIVFIGGTVDDKGQLGIITISASIIPTFIAGTAFLFYDKLNKNLQNIETEIVKLRKLSVFFKMIDSIPDEDSKKKAYDEIIKQMS